MEITIDQLFNGKATKIKNKPYFPTKAYTEPFLERMSKFTSDFRIQAQLPDQVTRTVTGEINMDDITYNRVWIQAVMPEEYSWDNHDEVIGMVYGLDVRKPIVKIYRGGLNRACTNLCVFSPSFLNIQELEPEKAINYKPVQSLMEQTSDLKAWIQKLKSTNWDRDEELIQQNLGRWIINAKHEAYEQGFGKVKLATSTVLDAYDLLFEDEESPYYVPEEEAVNMFDVYNAFTELISNDKGKDIMNKCEKTLLLKNILELE